MIASRLTSASQSTSMLALPTAMKSPAKPAAKSLGLGDGAVVTATPTAPRLPSTPPPTPTAVVSLEYLTIALYMSLALIVGVVDEAPASPSRTDAAR